MLRLWNVVDKYSHTKTNHANDFGDNTPIVHDQPCANLSFLAAASRPSRQQSLSLDFVSFKAFGKQLAAFAATKRFFKTSGSDVALDIEIHAVVYAMLLNNAFVAQHCFREVVNLHELLAQRFRF